MSDDNKWDRPEHPPPPLFFGKKERDLVQKYIDKYGPGNLDPNTGIFTPTS